MRYAIMSDPHGNLRAFEAAVDDARAAGVDGYLMLGDYYCDLPFADDIADIMRALPAVTAVRGNKEDYLINLAGRDPATFLDLQMRAVYWNYLNMRLDTLVYLTGLPVEADIEDSGRKIKIFHKGSRYFRYTSLMKLGSSKYAIWRKGGGQRGGYNDYIAGLIKDDSDIDGRLAEGGSDIYIYGHSHTQWHAFRGEKLILNPGSCGMALDFDNRAAYTILDVGREIKVDERRVEYDVEAAIRELIATGFYRETEVWSDMVIDELRTGIESVHFFFEHAHRVAEERGHGSNPFCDQDWIDAYSRWVKDPVYESIMTRGSI